jgi:MOSC domain-containing protein YiiM
MAQLLSVNVGLPREVEWKGRIVRSAVWKYPVQGRCRVRRLNLDGDGQADLAGHGGENLSLSIRSNRTGIGRSTQKPSGQCWAPW